MDTTFLANEAFIRRAAIINGDFMLKGSFVTRQYFTDPKLRKPADLDWLYLGDPIKDVDTARQVFNKWITSVTDCQLDDHVKITSFTENPFWRMIDYAMDDDFPTINTDLTATVHGQSVNFCVDLSFNLDPELPPVSIMYQPAEGRPFYLPKTPAPGNQIAWKLHQCIVRMRYKDLFDLYFMLQYSAFNKEVLTQALSVYVNECAADKKDALRIHYIVNGEWHRLLDVLNQKNTTELALLELSWHDWRNGLMQNSTWDYSNIRQITDNEHSIPTQLHTFIDLFVDVCSQSGLTQLCKNLPPVKEKQRTKFDGLF